MVQAFQVRVPACAIFRHTFNFSINHLLNTKTLVSIFKLINKKKYPIILKLEIIQIFHLITHWFDYLLV